MPNRDTLHRRCAKHDTIWCVEKLFQCPDCTAESAMIHRSAKLGVTEERIPDEPVPAPE